MNPFKQVFGGAFADTVYGRAARQQQEAYHAQQAWNNFANQPQGRPVDARLADEMLTRRTMNLCRQAADDGWEAEIVDGFGRSQCTFRKSNRIVRGLPHRDRRQALINATEELAKIIL